MCIRDSNNITYAIDKNGEDPVGSESNGKFTVDMDHAKDNMALTVNVNCQPNDAAEPCLLYTSNAAAIVEIQANILELQKLDGRITALETFNQNAASKDVYKRQALCCG